MSARFTLFSAATAALLAPLLYDAAIKGLLLLAAAGLVVLGLRGASAAARHLVWLVAVVALLAVPVLTVALPRWRVLPSWVAWPSLPKEPSSVKLPVEPGTGTGADTLKPPVNTPIETAATLDAEPLIPPPPAPIPAALSAPLPAASPRFSLASASAWAVAIWAGGFLILSGRLLAAQCLLRRVRRRAEPCLAGPLADALAEAACQLGVRQSVSLRLDAGRTIPLVWGVMRPCLLLPAEAGDWSPDQLRSVLLHELAHLKRRDPLVQVLMQGALALHWFNPLAWFAAWRLHVERERACDDLVLASGVRGSEYATHLLRIATELTPAPWTSACGLAMARRSSLEGRLRAVLNESCDRRGITRALTAAALFLALAIAIPVAMLRAAEDTPLIAAQPPQESELTVMEPKNQEARSLFQKWQSRARTDGRIPGALIGQLARQTDNYIQQYPDTPEASRLAALRSRLDAARDWPPAEAAGLLDEVAGIATAPVGWTSLPMEFNAFRTVVSGEPLPIELSSAAWGPPAENGLRAAWLLEPRAEQYALGTVLKVRVLFHNAGTQPVVFRTETWHQSDTLTVRDARGADVKTTGTWYTGITPLAVYRLLPGAYCEVGAPGVAIGAGTYEDERSTGRLGIVIDAKAGDELSLSSLVDAAQGITFSRPGDPNDPLELWRTQVAERVASEAPLPSAPADREQLIRRVVLDLTGEPPTAEETAVFVADPAPDALQSLTARLQAKQPTLPWTGKLQIGTTTFRVLPADPNAAKAPRSANAPGRYVLGDTVHLQVTQTTGDGSRRNKATLLFLSQDPKVPSPHTPYEISLPDGNGTYGIVWERGAGALWVLEKDIARKYDFGNPAQVKETRIQPGSLLNIPEHLQDTMKQAFDVAGSPVPRQNPAEETQGEGSVPSPLGDNALNLPQPGPGPRQPGRLKTDTEQKLAWGEPVNGLRAALVRVPPEPELQPGVVVDLNVVVQNVSDRTVAFRGGSPVAGAALRTVFADGSTAAVNQHILDLLSSIDEFTLQPREVAVMSLMSVLIGELAADSRSADPNRSVGYSTGTLANGAAVAGFSASLSFGHAPDPAFKGTLQTGTLRAAAVATAPAQRNSPASALDPATEAQLDWGEPANGLRGALFIRSPEAGIPGAITLAVQNVSGMPVRFMDTTKSQRLRSLYVSASGSTLFALSNDEPTMTDVILQPREVVFLSMMREDGDEVTAGLIEGLRKDSLQTWRAVLDMSFSVLGGGWSGTLTTGETRGLVREGGPHPNNERAQALFKHWQSSARLNGDIPGGLVALLHEKVKEFIRNNEPDASGAPFAQKMKPLEPRFAHTGDWKAADVVALLDDIAAAHTIPLDTTLRHLAERTLQPGTPLPASLDNADWGAPLPSGLRMAHVLEPRANGYHLGTELKARILLHNAGREPVAFLTDTFQQPGHAARRADGGDLKLDSTYWTTLGSMVAYRLAPGEYCEINTPGLGIGARVENRDDWASVRAGTWILCAEGDDVVFTPGAAQLSYREGPEKSGDWWPDFITERLNREAPVPTDPKEREFLLYRVVRYLYGAAPSTTEGDAFAADTSPDALKNLAALLAQHPYGKRSDGVIHAGSTKFRVLPPDADAASRPRVATGPGWYSLADNIKFSVTRRAAGSRVRNEASILHFQQGMDNVVHPVPLPDGHDTWAAATTKGATELWIAEAGTLRRYDFINPLQPAETRYEGGKLGEAPISKELRAALDPALSRPAAKPLKRNEPTPPPAADKPAAPATDQPKEAGAVLTPEALLGTWRGTVNGENLMLSFHRPPAETDVQLDIYFGEATIGALASFTIAENGGSAEVVQRSAGGGMKFGTLVPVDGASVPILSDIPHVGRLFRTKTGSFRALKLKLDGRQQGQTEVTLTRDAQTPSTAPQQAEARALFEMWQRTANPDGTIPGTFIGQLATAVRAFVRHNPTLDSALGLQKLLPRFVTTRAWTQAEAIHLLEDVQYYHFQPIMDRVAQAQLPSGPLWRTMVEFQDIPVEIASWSEAKDGLRIGLRVVGGQWSAGGSVRAELWLHNAGGEDVRFRTAGPNRQDVEVLFSAIDAGGQEHWPERSPLNIFAPLLDCVLPAGHVAMAKEFEVTFADAEHDVRTPLGHRFHDLKPGPYQLRCSLMVARPESAQSGEHIELPAPELQFTLAPAATESDPHKAEAPDSAIAPAPARAEGGPGAEVKPERTHLWNDTHAAVAFQTDKDVHFVLVAEGFLSTGLSESFSSTGRWSIEGNIHLVDREKSKAAGQNVDKRVIALKHTSDDPTKLYLDGKAYDLATPAASGAKGVAPLPGRLFILRAEGEPIQTARTLPLRNEKDLVTISDYAVRGGFMMENEAARPKEPK